MGRTTQAQNAGDPSPDEIRACLARLVGTSAFRASARRRRMLTYIVEQTLAGQGGRLKAYDLALAVLGREESFDPVNDPIVRIEVGRLRRDLQGYYEAEGCTDPIQITIPKGRYIPAFRFRAERPVPALATARKSVAARGLLDRRGSRFTGLCATVLLVGVTVWSLWPAGKDDQANGPVLVVVPFERLSGDEGGLLLANGLTNGLIADLMRFDGLQVFAAAPDGDSKSPLPGTARDAPAFVLSGGVERDSDRLRVTTRLVDRGSGRVLWSQRYEQVLTAAKLFQVQDDIAAQIASWLAQEYGVVNRAAFEQLALALPKTMFAYDCVQRAFAYRRTFAPERYWPVRACLEESVRRDPGYAGAWAMLAFAHMDAARFKLVDPAAQPGELDAGLAAAQRAVSLAPDGVRSLQSLAALHFARGDYDEAERVQRRAIALNPHNPESLAQLGWRLMARGHWKEGGQLLQEAIDRSMVVPTWYHECLAYALYLDGNLQQARDEAELGKTDQGYIILAITEAGLGHAEAASNALAQALHAVPVLATDPTAYWTTFHGAPDVIERLNAGLVKAGLQIPPLHKAVSTVEEP